MATALSFYDNAVDAIAVKNMGQEQAGRAAADDRHLGPLRRHCHRRLGEKNAGPSKGSILEIGKSIPQASAISRALCPLRGHGRRVEYHLFHAFGMRLAGTS